MRNRLYGFEIYLVKVETIRTISHIFVTFLEKLNFNNKIYSIFAHNLLIKGCEIPAWHADGYCDDINNNEACFFDGGDCCGSNVDEYYCDICQCLE